MSTAEYGLHLQDELIISEIGNLDVSKEIKQTLQSPEVLQAFSTIISSLLPKIAMKQVKEEMVEMREEIKHLSQKTNDLEQYSRRCSIRFFEMAEREDENVTEMVINFCNEVLKLDHIKMETIERCHRTGNSRAGKPRAILCKFARHDYKRDVIIAVRNLVKECRKERKALPHLKVYEDLTRSNMEVVREALKLRGKKKVRSVWTIDGKVMVKNNNNGIVRITNLSELREVFGEDMVESSIVLTQNDMCTEKSSNELSKCTTPWKSAGSSTSILQKPPTSPKPDVATVSRRSTRHSTAGVPVKS